MKNYIQKVAWALVLLLAATLSLSAKDGTAVRKLFKKGVSDSISVGGSKLVVLQKDLIRNRSLSVNSIGEENVPELDFAMTNVTAGGHGYRFLPHGTHFTGEGATVKIKYDRTRIPSGYTEDDIRTYYYDPAEKHWVALERVRVDKKEECVVSKTTHFTDMINGVIPGPGVTADRRLCPDDDERHQGGRPYGEDKCHCASKRKQPWLCQFAVSVRDAASTKRYAAKPWLAVQQRGR